MLQPLSWRRGGALALLVLAGLAGVALYLDADAGGELRPVIEQMAQSELQPVELVERTASGARIVLLSDVPGRPEPKRLAAESIRRLAAGPGLDAVLLAVPASEQRYIDAFMSGSSDATALLSRPAAVNEAYGGPREYLRIYEAVREVNEGLEASRRIRVVAGDVEGWPPPEGTRPAEVARLYAARSEQMLARLDRELFATIPDARVLVFVDGYLSLQGTRGELRFAGGESVRVQWLGELLRQRSGPDARTVLVDAVAPVGAAQQLPGYHGTRLHRELRRELTGPSATWVRGALAEVDDPVLELSTPGLRLHILPEGYRLGTVATGYVFLQ